MNNALLAKIHIGKKELGLADAEYRGLLQRIGKVASARDLSENAAVAVIEEFKRLGWKPATNPAGTRAKSAKPHVRKIFALWADAARRRLLKDDSRAALVAFVERQTGVAQPDWLTAAQANSVTEALKAMIQRCRP